MQSSTLNTDDIDGSPYRELDPLIIENAPDEPHILLHPDKFGRSANSPGLRDYTDEELAALAERDFETRLFITAKAIWGSSVWVRTHWTDNHVRTSALNNIRDYFKATHATKNFTAAKSALCEMLTMCMESEDSNYYSFAITVASGLSNIGENISFQVDDGLIKSQDEVNVARRKLCLMMHVIFSKMEISDFLYSGEGSNIYRLIYCTTRNNSKNMAQLFFPIFSFLLQLMLTVFVLAANISSRDFQFETMLSGIDDIATNLPMNLMLAIVTFLYSGMVAAPGVTEAAPAYKFYGGFGFLQVLDFIVNVILPFLILVSGFFIIANSESYIESVLNTAALLFIPEIDDQLPLLLGLNESVIIKNFLTNQSLLEFDELSMLKDESITDKYVRSIDEAIGVEFCDYYLTNWPEQGSTPKECIHFKPHEVATGKILSHGHRVNPTNAVNENCLIRKIIWNYTTGFPNTIKPRIGYLRLEMINGQVVQINMKTVNKRLGVEDVTHELEGVFIITSFQMSSTILRLRVCGTRNAEDFEKAFDYYALWSVTYHARKLLKDYQRIQNTYKKRPQSYKSYVKDNPVSMDFDVHP